MDGWELFNLTGAISWNCTHRRSSALELLSG